MAVAFDATAESTTGAIPATSLTFAHTCTGTGLVLIVGVASTASPTSVTYNGVPMNKISADVSNTAVSSLWFLAAPATGANNVVINMASSVTICGGTVSVKNASQTPPVNIVPSKASAVTAISGAIAPTQNNCILIDHLATNTNSSPTAGGSQTTEVTQSASGGAGQGMSYQIVTGTPTTAFSWTWVGSAAAAYQIIAIAPPILTSPKPNPLRPAIFKPGLAR